MEANVLLVLALIFFFSGLTSGLSGFGFSAIGAISLTLLPPATAVTLLMALSIVTQISSAGSLFAEMKANTRSITDREGPLTYCIGGLLGLPLGLLILTSFDSRTLTFLFGVFLLSYSAYSLFKPSSWVLHGMKTYRHQLVGIGFIGGVVGGFTAFPGSALVVWNGLRGIGKEASRAITQQYILFMQFVGLAFVLLVKPQTITPELVNAFFLMAPVSLVGNLLGVRIYRRTSNVNYRLFCLVMLSLSGAALMAKTLII